MHLHWFGHSNVSCLFLSWSWLWLSSLDPKYSLTLNLFISKGTLNSLIDSHVLHKPHDPCAYEQRATICVSLTACRGRHLQTWFVPPLILHELFWPLLVWLAMLASRDWVVIPLLSIIGSTPPEARFTHWSPTASQVSRIFLRAYVLPNDVFMLFDLHHCFEWTAYSPLFLKSSAVPPYRLARHTFLRLVDAPMHFLHW